MGFWGELESSLGLSKTNTSDTSSATGSLDSYTWGKLGKNSLAKKEYDKRAGMEAQALAQAQGSYDQSQQARAHQQRMLGEYEAMAAGRGPSLAREQLATGLGQAQAQASQTAASARGGGANALLANRAAQAQGSQAALQTNQQAAEIRAKEQLSAMEAQAGIASNMRAGDLSTRGQDLGLANSQMDAQMRINDSTLKGKMAAAGAHQQAAQFDADQQFKADESYRQRRQQFASGIMRGAASGGMSLVTG